jgi:hypothetical protein
MGPGCRQVDRTAWGSAVGVPWAVILAALSSADQEGGGALMAFREIPMFEVREVLRLWLSGRGYRTIEPLVRPDRKTIRRIVECAVDAGLVRDGGDGQLDDVFVGAVMLRLAQRRPDRHGDAWEVAVGVHERLKGWHEGGVPVVKMCELLERDRVVVPERTLHRYVAEQFGASPSSTVPLADGVPGRELQADFGELGWLVDPENGKRRRVWALVFSAVYSRHMFVWLTHGQTTGDVIAGCEAAWGFFGGVFGVLIPDNMGSIVTKANATDPVFNQTFVEYAQARGFVIDPARVRAPQDKARVERAVQFVQSSFWAGERFCDLAIAQDAATSWCMTRAGMRVHGTTHQQPLMTFNEHERSLLLPAPGEAYDVPVYTTAKVARDHHVQVAKALYSIPGDRRGQQVEVRADRALVKIFQRGTLIKTHPRVPAGSRSTDRDDLPAHVSAYALRDINRLISDAAVHGRAVGELAAQILDDPLPWTTMRRVYKLVGLCKTYGDERVDAAAGRLLEAESKDLRVLQRMLERALEQDQVTEPARSNVIVATARFARDNARYAAQREVQP